VTAADLCSCPEVRDAIAAAQGERSHDLSTIKASRYLKRMIGVRLDHRFAVGRIPNLGGRRSTQRWRLVPTTPDELTPDPLA
jgi:hypothetical protein